MLEKFLVDGTLSKDEVDFLNNYYESCPHSLRLLTICEEAVFVQYPYWMQHFRQYDLDAAENELKLLTFFSA